MDKKNITQIRINFNKKILLNLASYEDKISLKFKNNEKIQLFYKNKSNLNFCNYQLFNNLRNIKYRDAIYNVQNLKSKNDITKIILLFFPYFLKSNSLNLKYLNSEMSQLFDYSKLKFESAEKIDLQNNIKGFFENYDVLEKHKFKFHRREMLNYLEIFLNIYTEDEIISQEEIKEHLIYHYFRPFIRPENFI